MKKNAVSLVFFLMCLCISMTSGEVKPDLGNVMVYPNPFEPRLGHATVTFANTTADVRLRIYKITGELVFETDAEAADGIITWPVVTQDGQPLASGIYVYRISNEAGQTTSGKLAVMRSN